MVKRCFGKSGSRFIEVIGNLNGQLVDNQPVWRRTVSIEGCRLITIHSHYCRVLYRPLDVGLSRWLIAGN